MIINGVLLHVYHLETKNWKELVWGDPASDKLGTAAKFAEVLLDIPSDQEVKSVIFSGPSKKDGLIEGAYTKKFLLERLDSLIEFPTLKKKIESLDSEALRIFKSRVENIESGPIIKNTSEEMQQASEYLRQCDRVYQVASASHAPRCLKNQIQARAEGRIPKEQPWYTVPSDTFFCGSTADDVIILEPSHRGDDPMTGQSGITEALKPYFSLETEKKKELIKTISTFTRTNK